MKRVQMMVYMKRWVIRDLSSFIFLLKRIYCIITSVGFTYAVRLTVRVRTYYVAPHSNSSFQEQRLPNYNWLPVFVKTTIFIDQSDSVCSWRFFGLSIHVICIYNLFETKWQLQTAINSEIVFIKIRLGGSGCFFLPFRMLLSDGS
jgi:hypothetical protein